MDPKGERLVYASGKSVFLRNIDDPSISTQYTGHTSVATVARFSPSGYYIASGDSNGTIRVWDAVGEDMITKGEFPIISGAIKDLAWDGESKRIIAVGDGKERFGGAVTFDTGNSVGEISGQSSVINSVSIRQQRPYRAATASDDQTVVFYHGAPFKFNTLLNGHHSGFVHGVAFSPDGSFFVSVGADRKIFLFDGKEGGLIAEIKDEDSHRGSILSISWAPDSTRFVTASTDQTVKIWDVASKKNTQTWKFGPENTPSVPDHQVGVVWTPRADGLIISLSLSGALNYLTESSPTPIRTVVGHQKPLTALAITADKTAFTGSTDGRICRWLPGAGLADIVDGPAHTNNVTGFALTSSGVASIAWDDHIRQIDAAASLFTSGAATTSQPLAIATQGNNTLVLTRNSIDTYTSPTTAPSSNPLSFDPTTLGASSTLTAIGGTDSQIRIFAGTTLKHTLTTNRAPATALTFSPDGTHLAAGDSSGKIILYDTATFEVKTSRWAFHSARIESIAWNKDGTHIVSGSLDTHLYVYSVERPVKNRKVKNAHEGGIKAVAWESENIVVSAGADGAVKRWECTELP